MVYGVQCNKQSDCSISYANFYENHDGREIRYIRSLSIAVLHFNNIYVVKCVSWGYQKGMILYKDDISRFTAAQ